MNITPGSPVTVEVVAIPSRAAAAKTIIRICRKDAEIARSQRRFRERRPSWQETRRGGCMWHHQMASKAPVRLTPGAKYQVRATVDVLRDLASVQRWVKVTPA